MASGHSHFSFTPLSIQPFQKSTEYFRTIQWFMWHPYCLPFAIEMFVLAFLDEILVKVFGFRPDKWADNYRNSWIFSLVSIKGWTIKYWTTSGNCNTALSQYFKGDCYRHIYLSTSIKLPVIKVYTLFKYKNKIETKTSIAFYWNKTSVLVCYLEWKQNCENFVD